MEDATRAALAEAKARFADLQTQLKKLEGLLK